MAFVAATFPLTPIPLGEPRLGLRKGTFQPLGGKSRVASAAGAFRTSSRRVSGDSAAHATPRYMCRYRGSESPDAAPAPWRPCFCRPPAGPSMVTIMAQDILFNQGTERPKTIDAVSVRGLPQFRFAERQSEAA